MKIGTEELRIGCEARAKLSVSDSKSSCVPALKLSRYPRFFAATLAALPSISEIPFLDSCFPDSLSS